jgi:hypothetical protein
MMCSFPSEEEVRLLTSMTNLERLVVPIDSMHALLRYDDFELWQRGQQPRRMLRWQPD